MRKKAAEILNGYALKKNKGFECLVDAVCMYDGVKSLKSIYSEIGSNRGMSAIAVEKSVATCIDSAVYDCEQTPKAFIARIKERIMFDFDE